MLDGRRSPRYRSLARAQVSEVSGVEGFLKNISITGCCMECTGEADVQPETRYQMVIKPERESHIGSFELQVECKWIRNDGYSVELGFNIIASPKGKQFFRYVDYLAFSHSHS